MATDLLRKAQPSSEEFFFLLIITGIFTVLLIYSDIVVHDTYILHLVAQCHSQNHESICDLLRSIQGLPMDAQLSIGNAYWGILLIQVITVAGIIGLLRIMFAKLAGAKIDSMVIFTGFLWFATASAFYFFGFLDAGYYKLRGLEIPPQLEWLDGVGLFTLVQNFGETSSVDRSDLFLLMFIGLVLVVGSWVLVTHHYKKGTLKKIGIVSRNG